MPSAPPDGIAAPADGRLPSSVADGADERTFGVYLHVPFCAVRCGYCDFNTYTSSELAGAAGAGADLAGYATTALTELDLAAEVMAAAGLPARPTSTVFLGGGTPTLLPAADLARLLTGVRDRFGLVGGAEVTTEANPDSVTPQALEQLAAAGFTRVSFGMQSAVPHVLATLDRTHDPARVPVAVAWARAAGLGVSLDLIYGTPGESAADWRASLDAALACGPDHVSAYALVVEEGTRMAAAVRRGTLPRPDDDTLADRYELADDVLTAAGLAWYEVSNWARTPRRGLPAQPRLLAWRRLVGGGAGGALPRGWGALVERAAPACLRGPVGGRRQPPAQAREVLGPDERYAERVLLGVRLAAGLPLAALEPAGRGRVGELIADGLVEAAGALGGAGPRRLVLTRRGRLLADGVVRTLLG